MTSARRMEDAGTALPRVLERAKGALMLQFGIDSHQSFALLLQWSQQQGRAVEDLASVLVLGVVEEDPATLADEGPLVGWLEERLTGEPSDGGSARERHLRS